MRAPMTAKLAATALADIKADQALADFTYAQGRSSFRENCGPCHGAGGGGAKGYPNLNDNDWLWGGTLEQIQQTIEFGVRSGHAKAHESQMPAFGKDGMLKRDEIVAVANYVRSIANLSTRPGPTLARARQIYADNCAVCHGPDGKGNKELGAPEPDRRHLAVRLGRGRDHRGDRQLAQRRDAGLGRPARSDDHQGADLLRAFARRRGEVIRAAERDQRVARPPAGTRSADCSRSPGAPRSRLSRRPSVAPPLDPSADEWIDDAPLYEARRKIYPQRVSGTYRRIKWAVLFVTLGIYYFTPFLRWDRGPNAPGQAVLIDLPNSRFYFFFIEIWPQEVYYLTGLLIIAAMALFLMNALAGPHLVRLSLPADGVDRPVPDDRALVRGRPARAPARDRRRLDRASASRALAAKHFLWLMVAWWTGGAWVLYFADAPTLVRDLATLNAPFVAYLWIGILTFTTYVLAGHMREQVCLYMCPWPRIQAALTDEHALNVTYRYDRGEPRASVKKATALRAQGTARRRLRRLPAMRACLPDRRRHPQRA